MNGSRKISKIPNELKSLKQWVGVSSETKIPLTISGVPASPVDPNTWTYFQDVEKRVDSGFFSYVGFVFTKEDGYIGIDIDKGFDSDNTLTTMAYDIISACKSYTERSKSGRGVHIIVKGSIPMTGLNNFAGVEIYSCKRYFVTTGDVFIYNRIVENQNAIDYVLQKYFSNIKTKESQMQDTLYSIEYDYFLKAGKFGCTPNYSAITEGARHMSLLSAAGQLWSIGYDVEAITHHLSKINELCCTPPLESKEIRAIAKSISKYERSFLNERGTIKDSISTCLQEENK